MFDVDFAIRVFDRSLRDSAVTIFPNSTGTVGRRFGCGVAFDRPVASTCCLSDDFNNKVTRMG
jgi:hypothetical protein